MIDFPNAPADGQIFSAPNGVIYRYSAANTAWLTQSQPQALGGQIIRDITLAAPAPTIDLFNLGPVYKTIDLVFSLKPVNDAVGVYLRWVRGNVVDNSATYYSLLLYGSGSAPRQRLPSPTCRLSTSASNFTAWYSGPVSPGGGANLGSAGNFNNTTMNTDNGTGGATAFSILPPLRGNWQTGSFVRVIGWP